VERRSHDLVRWNCHRRSCHRVIVSSRRLARALMPQWAPLLGEAAHATGYFSVLYSSVVSSRWDCGYLGHRQCHRQMSLFLFFFATERTRCLLVRGWLGTHDQSFSMSRGWDGCISGSGIGDMPLYTYCTVQYSLVIPINPGTHRRTAEGTPR
jgi:hypothetical protein